MQLGRDFVRALAQITKKGEKTFPRGDRFEPGTALISAYKKYQGGNQDVEVHIDSENGDISICEVKHVVAEVTAPDTEISIEEAHSKGFVDVAEGDYIRIERNPENFGRIAARRQLGR